VKSELAPAGLCPSFGVPGSDTLLADECSVDDAADLADKGAVVTVATMLLYRANWHHKHSVPEDARLDLQEGLSAAAPLGCSETSVYEVAVWRRAVAVAGTVQAHHPLVALCTQAQRHLDGIVYRHLDDIE